ncbi:hypothetical protein RBSWK_05410 [Rhodopirellula baltica SWK14]|uniref:Uncharacterized protein n=1 Tax=Rhodopirellula baltica SWK14 TaxID=993516 RepID=L7CC53_RHOBT|nr:hypothetical protein RBSWK_05410 [Rhodopirellula baltica SWK14]
MENPIGESAQSASPVDGRDCFAQCNNVLVRSLAERLPPSIGMMDEDAGEVLIRAGRCRRETRWAANEKSTA